MISVLRLLQDVDSTLKITGETGGIKERICMTRCKSRFGQPTSGGWADIMINFYFEDDEERSAHICEIQLVHAHLYSVRKNMGAHQGYNEFRAALELCEKVGANPEEGSEPAALEASVRLQHATHNQCEIGPSKLQTEQIATLEAQNDKMATQMEILEAQNEEMSAQMRKMSAVLATLTINLPHATVAMADQEIRVSVETTMDGAGTPPPV
jgi:hypothetical protein